LSSVAQFDLFRLQFQLTRAIHVIAVITAIGENMIAESTETATSTANAEPKASKKASFGAQGAHVAPEKASSKKVASRRNGAPEGQKKAKGGKAKGAATKKKAKTTKKKAKPTRAKDATTPRAESKGAKILEMIGRAKGATLA
jgi:hypothetical protein